MLSTDRDLLELVLSDVGKDFPDHQSAFADLSAAFHASVAGGTMRTLDRACARFFEDSKVPWRRYDLYRRYWAEFELPPDVDGPEDEERTDTGPDTLEMGRLLAQWTVSSYYMESRRRRYTNNAEDRPQWRLMSSICPYIGHRKLNGQTHHYLSSFWRQRQIPGPRLDCRCQMQALTEQEASVPAESEAAQLARACVVLVPYLLEGRDVGIGGFPPDTMVALRSVQIIGESIKIIRSTKNDATRMSRLGVVADTLGKLRAHWTTSLPPEACRSVLAAVEQCSSQGIAAHLLDRAAVFSRRAARSKNPVTRKKALDEAVLVLSSASASVCKGEDAAKLQRELEAIKIARHVV